MNRQKGIGGSVSGIGKQFTRCACLVLLLAGGCASTHNQLTMTSLDQRHVFNQTFSRAYSSLNDNGDYEIVLVHDANADHLGASDGPVQPAEVTPRQLVHIRVFWLAHHDTMLDHPVAANASIRWYLFGDRADESADVLEYSGSALVLVKDDGRISTITVRGAALKAVGRRGEMADPLGPSTVNGTIIARVDRKGVNDVLSEVQTAANAGPLQAAIAKY